MPTKDKAVEPKPEEKPKAKAKAKTPEQLQESLKDALDQFPELTNEEPYINDAHSFLQQAIACLGKQISTNV